MKPLEIQDPKVFDLDALAKWYIELRTYKSEVKRSIEPVVSSIDEQMELISTEMNRRLAESSATSIRTAHGTIGRVLKTRFNVTDPYLFKQWIVQNPELGVNLISGSITQGEVKSYMESNPDAQLPDGLTFDQFFDISVRRS